MNDNEFENFIRPLSRLDLTEAARSRIREHLVAYSDLHYVSTHAPRKRLGVLSPFLRPVLALMLVLLVGGGGVAYAAEGTLPGDTLYPVKVGVVEPVEGALIPTPSGKASWHAILAERRLEEAATLAVNDRLDEPTRQTLERRFAAQVDTSLALADDLSQKGQTTSSLDVRSDIEARLAAHADLLDLLSTHVTTESGRDTQTKHETHTLSVTVHNKLETVVSGRVALEKSVGVPASNDLDLIASVNQTLADTLSQTNASSTIAGSVVKKHLNAANQELVQARKLATTSPKDAYLEARAATRSIQEASILNRNQKLLTGISTMLETSPSAEDLNLLNQDATSSASTTPESMNGE